MIEGPPARVAGSVNWNWLGGAFLLFVFVEIPPRDSFGQEEVSLRYDEESPLDPEKLDSSCSCDFEALGRVTPATSISELSVYFLRKCKERCRVLGSRYKFFGGVTMAGVKVIARSRHAADTCTRDKRMDHGRLSGKWTKYFLYIFHR